MGANDVAGTLAVNSTGGGKLAVRLTNVSNAEARRRSRMLSSLEHGKYVRSTYFMHMSTPGGELDALSGERGFEWCIKYAPSQMLTFPLPEELSDDHGTLARLVPLLAVCLRFPSRKCAAGADPAGAGEPFA